MKIIVRAVLDWETCEVLEEDSYEYSGPVAESKSSGSPPQPVNPYDQAAAQYGLSTGTANYNAALDRTNSSNPLGSNTWSVTGTDGTGPGGGYSPSNYFGVGGAPSAPYGFGGAPSMSTGTQGGSAPASTGAGFVNGVYTPNASPAAASGGMGGSGLPLSTPGATGSMGMGPSGPGATVGTGMNGGSGAPIYAQQTSLTPWANNMLQQPIDTSQIPGMPGGPSLEGNVNDAEQSTYNQEMQLLQPQEQQQQEQTTAQLEGEGAMPGSPAYEYGQKMLGLTQGAENTSAANQAVTTGMGELPMLYGLGSTSLQNQLAERNAPISEYEALTGNPSANVSAMTPDISGAFGQQYSGQLAGYNANVASNNATTGGITSLLAAAAIAY